MALPTNTIVANHTKTVTPYDDGDANHVQGADWNDDHPVTGFGVISSNCTLTVGATGCDYTTVGAALSALNNYWIAATATVTISVAAETFAESPIVFKHACGANVCITGAASVTTTMSSITAASGSAGNSTATLQLASVTGARVGGFVLVTGATGGTTPQRILGLHKISSVDAGNVRVTVAVRNKAGVNTPSAVTGNVRIFKSVLEFASGKALLLDNSRLGRVSDIVFDCSASTASPSIEVRNSGSLDLAGRVGLNGNASAWGIVCGQGSSLDFTDGALSGSQYGIYANMGGYIQAHRNVVTGVANDGFLLARQSSLSASDCVSTGNTTGIIASHSSFASIGSSYYIADNTGSQFSPAYTTVGNNNAYIGPG